MSRQLKTVSVTMADDGTETSVADIGSMINATLQIPAAWVTATVTFKGGFSRGTMAAVSDKEGVAVSIPGTEASKSYEINAAVMNFPYISIVSGAGQTGGPLTLRIVGKT